MTKQDAIQRKLHLQRYFQLKCTTSLSSTPIAPTSTTQNPDPTLSAPPNARPPAWLTYSFNECSARRREFSKGKPPKEVSPFIDQLCRFTIAAVGGSFLVGPMLIMAISPSTTKSLVTVSVSVMIFIAVLTFVVKPANVEALVSTATYAAVLVVFVGSSTGIRR